MRTGFFAEQKTEKRFLRCPVYILVALPTEIYLPYLTPEDVFVKQADMKKNCLIPKKKLKKIKKHNSKI